MNAILRTPVTRPSTDVEAVLNYTRNTGVRPVNYTFDPPLGVPRYGGEIDARSVTIHDARTRRRLSLDVSGFELITHHSSLKLLAQFQDENAVRAVDYPEVEAALRTVTGAEKVILFD